MTPNQSDTKVIPLWYRFGSASDRRHPSSGDRWLLRFAIAASIACAGCWEQHRDEPVTFVDVNLPLDDECRPILDHDQGLPSGQYDISAGSGPCKRDYETHLRINSFRRDERVEPGAETVLQVHLAEVTLMGEDGKPMAFSTGDPPLPNPFEQRTGVSLFPDRAEGQSIASVTIQAIPAAYASYLTDFVGQTVVADIQLFITTTHGEDLDFEPFSYPIEICDGCLTACASESTGDNASSGACYDNAGQDGRTCIDAGC